MRHRQPRSILHVGSWYDAFQYDTLAMYTAMRDHATNRKRAAGRNSSSVSGRICCAYAIPTSRGTGDIDFGPEAKINCTQFNCDGSISFLKGLPTAA